jgi:hypothetical protein
MPNREISFVRDVKHLNVQVSAIGETFSQIVAPRAVVRRDRHDGMFAAQPNALQEFSVVQHFHDVHFHSETFSFVRFNDVLFGKHKV